MNKSARTPDDERLAFIGQLYTAWGRDEVILTELEADFVTRMICEYPQESAERDEPIFAGDANICDSLKRKYKI